MADANETVTYSLNGTTIERQDGAAAPLPLVEDVPADGLEFHYYDGSNPPNELGAGAVLTQNQLNCVSKIRIIARADVPHPDPRVDMALVSQAESEIAIRNLSLQNF